jgi:uncharacterized damage-inducible protein DinB
MDDTEAPDRPLLEALLDSWDRNNAILVNLLNLLPEGGLEAKVMDSSPTVAQMFMHIHFVRLVFVLEDAPEFAAPLPEGEWKNESDPARIAVLLNGSSQVVRDAVKGRLETGQPMNRHYDHPLLMLQHMVWHEGYHHGQIKLALKMAGRPIGDEEASPGTWGIWMDRK